MARAVRGGIANPRHESTRFNSERRLQKLKENKMICWILNVNLENYKQLCAGDGVTPNIIEQTEDKAHVSMTSNTARTWSMVGYWFEMG